MTPYAIFRICKHVSLSSGIKLSAYYDYKKDMGEFLLKKHK